MSSEVFEKINETIKDAMKSHDNLKRDCLRSIMSEIKNQTVNAGKDITDDICIKVLQKSVKTHNDSIAQFAYAGRDDLLEKEKAEVGILNEFLPKMMSDDEVKSLVEDVVKQLAEQFGRPMTKKDMGIVMKTLSTLPNASSVNMKIASKHVASLLV